MEVHRKNLKGLCRICYKKLGRVSYDCRAPTADENDIPLAPLVHEITSVIGDDPEIHPPRFCHSCYNTLKRMRASRASGKVYRTSMNLQAWSKHRDTECTICDMVADRRCGGRPRKKYILGRLTNL